jgi:hypothetical protein
MIDPSDPAMSQPPKRGRPQQPPAQQAGTLEAAKLAALVKLSTRQLTNLAKAGWFPPAPEGGRYPVGQTLLGLVNYYRYQAEKKTDDLAKEELRFKTAKADIAEIERDKRKGKLVELTQAEASWDNLILSFRSRALTLPIKTAPLVLHCKSQAEAQALLAKEVGECLQELSRPVDYKQAEPEPLPDDPEPTT